jgi:tRNA(Ile)-lysidine synthase
VPPPPTAKLAAACRQLLDAAGDRSPRVAWAGVELRLYRDLVYCLPLRSPVDPRWSADWRIEEPLSLPGGDELRAVPDLGCGVRAAVLSPSPRLLVRFRRGGERCQPDGRRHSRDLKRWFQAHGVPPWERERMPLLYLGEALLAIGDRWVCAPYAAAAGEPGYRIEWRPAGGAASGLAREAGSGRWGRPSEAGRVVEQGPIW